MTVEELINKLEDLPSDHKVFTEGCDCIGTANDAVLYSDWWKGRPIQSSKVIITRK